MSDIFILASTVVMPADDGTKAFRHVLKFRPGHPSPFVVHTQTMDDKAFYNGYYAVCLMDSLDYFKARANKDNLEILEYGKDKS